MAHQTLSGNYFPHLEEYRNTELGATVKVVSEMECCVYGFTIYNPNTVQVYVKLFDSGDVTLGETEPSYVLNVPMGATDNNGKLVLSPQDIPYRAFSNALSIACVTGLADDDDTPPTTPIYIELFYLNSKPS